MFLQEIYLRFLPATTIITFVLLPFLLLFTSFSKQQPPDCVKGTVCYIGSEPFTQICIKTLGEQILPVKTDKTTEKKLGEHTLEILYFYGTIKTINETEQIFELKYFSSEK